MKKITQILKENWIIYIIILQPILDIISYFQSKYIGGSYSWIFRIAILAVVGIVSFINSKNKKSLILFILPYILFYIAHIINLYRINEFNLVVDTKYFINVFQTPILAIFLIDYVKSKNYDLNKIKKSLLITFIIIVASIAIAYVTKTFQYTYSSYKGITGWFSSANTSSMILCLLAPWALYILSKSEKWYIYLLINIIVFTTLYFNATKACYLTLIASMSLMIFILSTSKEVSKRTFKIIISSFFLILSFVLYNFSFTSNRVDELSFTTDEDSKIIKDIAIDKNIEEFDFDNIDVYDNELIGKILETSYIYVEVMDIQGKDAVIDIMRPHISASALSDNRLRKVINAKIEYNQSDCLTKGLGIGYSRIAKQSLDLENDIQALYYYYGYIGFAVYLTIFILFIARSFLLFLKSPKLIRNGEFIMLNFLILLSILGGEYSGALLRKANANIYLSLLLLLLFFKHTYIVKNIINTSKDKKKISFLLLHLGFGGVESSTINTANALCDKFNIELIVFYKLKNNQESSLNSKIKIKYLYDGEPNRDSFINALKTKKIIKLLKEGFIALNILIKKKILIKKEILNSDSFAIVSTRSSFSKLLNKYGSKNTIKIAQEHHHHNNDKKYISILKNNYKNIDYLFALTESLKKDYEQFLKNNSHTKIVLVPNMLIRTNNNEISNVSNKNIITISRLHEGKRINELIEIFSKLKDKKSLLYIIGDGDEKNNIKELIKEKNLEDRVILTGYLKREDQLQYILKSSIYAMTSISEGLPMVLLEAMCIGLPCIAYRTESGVEDIIVNNKNGFIIENRNQDEYINKLDFLLENIEKRREMSLNALEYVDKFSEDNIIKIWLKILNSNN